MIEIIVVVLVLCIFLTVLGMLWLRKRPKLFDYTLVGGAESFPIVHAREYTKDEIESFRNSVVNAINTIRTRKIKHAIDLNVDDNVKICVFGDIHGDLETLQRGVKDVLADYYIFLGDYIDKGAENMHSLQFVLDKFVSDPEHVITLVGNHEKSFAFDILRELVASTQGFDSDIIERVEELFELMPICCVITFSSSNRKVFCAHGAYPFMYTCNKYKFVDKYADVWKILGVDAGEPCETELKYEDNTTYNLSITEYVNKMYDDVAEAAVAVVESPEDEQLFTMLIKRFNKLLDEHVSDSEKETIQKELRTKMLKPVNSFIYRWKLYKNYVTRLENAKQRLIDLITYVTWGDMYVKHVDDAEWKAAEDGDVQGFLDMFARNHTEFIYNHARREVVRKNLKYPEEQLKKWMQNNNINLFIRGHEIPVRLCTVRNLLTGEEDTTPTKIEFDVNSMKYVYLHSTKSYLKCTPTLWNEPKVVLINDNVVGVIKVNCDNDVKNE